MLTTREFLDNHRISKDVLLLIIAAADLQLAARLKNTCDTTLLFKFFIYVIGKLNELKRDFPHLLDYPESRRLVPPGKPIHITNSMFSLLSGLLGYHPQTETNDSIFTARRVFQTSNSKQAMYRSLCFEGPPKTDIESLIAAQPSRWNLFSNWQRDIRQCRASDGFTPLHSAAATGNLAAVAFLVKQNVPLAAFCHNGLTPLYYAVKFGHRDVSILLVSAMNEQGIDLNANLHPFGINPYFIALELGREDFLCVNENQQRCLATAQSDDSKAMTAAIALGAVNTMKQLLAAKVEHFGFYDAKHGLYCDELALAAGFNEFEITRLLLLHFAYDFYANSMGEMRWSDTSQMLTQGNYQKKCNQVEHITTSPLIKLYILYTKALAVKMTDNVDDVNVVDLVSWVNVSDQPIKEAAQYLLNDIQHGGFRPQDYLKHYMHVDITILKETMEENEQIFLDAFKHIPGLRAGR